MDRITPSRHRSTHSRNDGYARVRGHEKLRKSTRRKQGKVMERNFKETQQDLTELNGDGNRERGRYGEDESNEAKDAPETEEQRNVTA